VSDWKLLVAIGYTAVMIPFIVWIVGFDGLATIDCFVGVESRCK